MNASRLTAFAQAAGVSISWLVDGVGDEDAEVARFLAKHPEGGPEPYPITMARRDERFDAMVREDSPPYGRPAIDASHFSDRLLAEIIEELSAKTELSSDQRMQLVAPYQAELLRRVRQAAFLRQ